MTLWIPLSPEEKSHYLNQDQSKFKYEHCHYGQGRVSTMKCKIDQVLWKWNEDRPGANRLANLTDVLDYMEQRKKTPDGSCNILFIGDSLAHDHTMASYCQLEQAGYIAKSYRVAMGKPELYGRDIINNISSV